MVAQDVTKRSKRSRQAASDTSIFSVLSSTLAVVAATSAVTCSAAYHADSTVMTFSSSTQYFCAQAAS